MSKYIKLKIVLKNSTSHEPYNSRIVDYLKDRHTYLNDNSFIINIIIAQDEDINKFIAKGISSLPALKIDDDEEYIYGVNSIIATLAQLEQVPMQQAQQIQQQEQMQPKNDSLNDYYDNSLKELLAGGDEDDNGNSSYSSMTAESPINQNEIEEKLKKYASIYEKNNNTPSAPHSVNKKTRQNMALPKLPVQKNIQQHTKDHIANNKTFDDIEKMMLQQTL